MSVAVFTAALLAIVVFRYVIIARLRKKIAPTRHVFHEILSPGIESNIIPFMIVAALYASVQGLWMNESLRKIFHISVSILLVFFAVRALLALISFLLEHRWKQPSATGAQGQSLKALRAGVQGVVWAVAIIVLLDNLGVKISTLVAGLGIGGIAVALAAQTMLGDIFSYFMILLDRPFEVGDFVIVNDLMGTVEHVGIKSTRVRSLGGELLVFRNTDLTDSRIRNFKKMEQRRIVFSIGVTYGTSQEHLKKIPLLIASIVGSVKNTRFDRAHFKEFGDFSLVYEAAYYVLSPDYNTYMDIQQEINFKIRDEFEKAGIEFAYPTHTVYCARQQPDHLTHETRGSS
ncbi:MAG: mechanosensitive ion channel family protein [Chitinispirillaceae bacterium]|nr:mechanosensitive ion channel family protein [Chitinispirillaceae bacterium]